MCSFIRYSSTSFKESTPLSAQSRSHTLQRVQRKQQTLLKFTTNNGKPFHWTEIQWRPNFNATLDNNQSIKLKQNWKCPCGQMYTVTAGQSVGPRFISRARRTNSVSHNWVDVGNTETKLFRSTWRLASESQRESSRHIMQLARWKRTGCRSRSTSPPAIVNQRQMTT